MAVKLKKVNVDAMLRTITAKQFVEWEAYARMEPFNETRADYRAASIAQMVFNMAVDVKNRKPISDFLLKFGETQQQRPKQTWQQQQKMLMILAAMHAKDSQES